VDAVIGVQGLWVGALELIWRIRHFIVGRSLVPLTGSPPAQGLVRVVELPTDAHQALVSGAFEPPLRLGPPQRVLLSDQFLDSIQDGLLVHEASIVCVPPRPPTAR
jgi:hypothetical protein